MSQAGSEVQSREPAVRVFAEELLDATHEFKLSEGEMAPNYTLLPTGRRANRVLVYGALTSTTEQEAEGGSYIQARVNDGKGTFYLTASQYQSDARLTLMDLETPTFVGVVGKLKHYQTNDGDDRIEIRPETVSEVPKNDRDEWLMETVEHTMERIQRYEQAADGEDDDIDRAREEYDADMSQYVDHVEELLDDVFVQEPAE